MSKHSGRSRHTADGKPARPAHISNDRPLRRTHRCVKIGSRPAEATMKYLLLIYLNPQSRAIWAGFTDDQRAAGLQVYAALNEELAGSGELIITERLADPSLTQLVPQRDIGSSTDGPFAAAKEQIAGFYLVQCDNIDRARQIAARIPETPGGYV